MTEPNNASDPTEALFAAAGWPQILGRVIGRICHDLNGRILAIDAIAHLMGHDGVSISDIHKETEKLQLLSKLLNQMSMRRRGEPTPQVLGDLLRAAHDVHEKAAGYDAITPEISVDENAPAVIGREDRCLRGAILFLDLVQESLGAKTGHVSAMRDADFGVLRADVGERIDPSPWRALDEAMRLDGGTVQLQGSVAELRLPILPRE